MFINLEEEKIKLYEFKMGKELEEIKQKLILDSPYDIKVVEETKLLYHEESLINDGKDMIKFITWRDTGTWQISHNELQWEDEPIYEYTYYIYHLNEIYRILKRLGKENYNALHVLNKYIHGKAHTKEQQIFEKYRNSILRNICLYEYIDEESQTISRIYEELLNVSECELKKFLKMLNIHIYQMQLDGIPKKVKARKI